MKGDFQNEKLYERCIHAEREGTGYDTGGYLLGL
jgi:hypothetical protein